MRKNNMVDGKTAVLYTAKSIYDSIGKSKYRIFTEKTEHIEKESIIIRIVSMERKEGNVVFTRKMSFEISFAKPTDEKLKYDDLYSFASDMERCLLPSFTMAERRVKPQNCIAKMENGIPIFKFDVVFCDDDTVVTDENLEEMEELIYGITQN